MESLSDIVVSGVSVQVNESDKIFQLLRIDITVIMSHHSAFLVKMLEKIEFEKTTRNILVISPVEFFARRKKPKTRHNIQFVSFDEKLEAIGEKLVLLMAPKQVTIKGKKPEILSRITTREKEILDRIKKGKKTKEIAEELFLSVKTVESHRNNILKKTKTKSMIALINELHSSDPHN